MAGIPFDFDVAYDVPNYEQEIRGIAEKHGVTVVQFIHEGPGGGNPNFKCEAPTGRVACEMLAEVYGLNPTPQRLAILASEFGVTL